MSVKVIIMDVDGTLTNSKKKISVKTKEALIKAQQAGTILVLASGRPVTGLLDISKELQMDKHHGLIVAFNGSKVIDAQNGNILYNQTMSIEDGKAVLEHMKHFNVCPMIDKEDYLYVNNVYDCWITFNNQRVNIIEYESRGGKFKLCEIDDLAKFVHFPLNKILVAADENYLKENYQEMAKPFNEKLHSVFTAPMYFEFTAKGIDKANALKEVLTPIGYSRDEMIAFGDGHNDASMLNFAGTGIAMGNAVDDLKAIADEITLSNDEDGIAFSLYKHMPELFQ